MGRADIVLVRRGSDGGITEDMLSVGAAAGIVAAVSLLVVLPLGVVLGCCGLWCLMKSRVRKRKENAPAYYEEVQRPGKTVISLTENEAYGQIIPR